MGAITGRLAGFAGPVGHAALPGAVRERTRTGVADPFRVAGRPHREAPLRPDAAVALRRFDGGAAPPARGGGGHRPSRPRAPWRRTGRPGDRRR